MGFWLKKAITAMILPVPLACGLILGGLLLRRRAPKLALTLLLAGPVYLLALSFSPISTALANSLESHYASWQPGTDVAYVLVLGSSHSSHPDRAATAQLSATALGRLMEGIRVWRANPDATLVLSGFAGSDPTPHAELMKRAAMEQGVPESHIHTFPQARDTEQEARLTAPLVGTAPAVLVTSASHMDRALSLYQAQGLSVTPAATDFIAQPTRAWYFSARNLWTSQRVIHEYLGQLWLAIKS
ncbi:ElyC/SanA/YdcF family protein [Ferrimonas balearica]|uniref:ElyC/SanA/YdcF family protein n=1 Tax=Ferrimonas balearica TaxID=44012 RepID=UPI001F3AAEEB|nr:ElyC/SanA/YdcF family protein [Ferrimonas balearica]MBY6018319.1 YdcF family protein [Halomonas denitrificans]MBY6094658.1 YdcF family protein [Ferrimonas balearica]